MAEKKKATAPRPVTGGREAQAESDDLSREIIEITFRGETHRLAWRAVPVSEKVAVRSQVGLAWHEVTGENGVEADITTVAVLVWLSRRAAGEPKLPWVLHAAAWPADLMMTEVASRIVPADELELTDPPS